MCAIDSHAVRWEPRLKVPLQVPLLAEREGKNKVPGTLKDGISSELRRRVKLKGTGNGDSVNCKAMEWVVRFTRRARRTLWKVLSNSVTSERNAEQDRAESVR